MVSLLVPVAIIDKDDTQHIIGTEIVLNRGQYENVVPTHGCKETFDSFNSMYGKYHHVRIVNIDAHYDIDISRSKLRCYYEHRAGRGFISDMSYALVSMALSNEIGTNEDYYNDVFLKILESNVYKYIYYTGIHDRHIRVVFPMDGNYYPIRKCDSDSNDCVIDVELTAENFAMQTFPLRLIHLNTYAKEEIGVLHKLSGS